MYWLGIDVGTTGTRALLVDAEGKTCGVRTEAHQPIAIEYPQWAEQDPNDWWRACQVAVRGVLKDTEVASEDIAAVGVTGQMHGLTLIDANDQSLGPAIIWCDQRTAAEVDEMERTIGVEEIRCRTANRTVTGFTAPKLLWVRKHRQWALDRAKTIQLPKDYVRSRLCGDYWMDVSDASGTGLFDVAHRQWSQEMLSDLGLDRALFPDVRESAEIVGEVTKAAANCTGLRAGTPVIAGAGDQAAGAVGNGIIESDTVLVTVGSSGVVFAPSNISNSDPSGRIHAFCHAAAGRWHVMGVTQGAGLSLRWYRDCFSSTAFRLNYEYLSEIAATARPGSCGLVFLPYLMGERCPHLDGEARGAWVGITGAHTQADMVRSVMEGVAFSLRDLLEIFRDRGIRPQQLRVSGGGSRSEVWRRIQAGTFGLPISVPLNDQGPAYGVALLAMVATGQFKSVPEACRACVIVSEPEAPKADEVAKYEELYRTFSSLYMSLRTSMHALSSFDRDTSVALRESAT